MLNAISTFMQQYHDIVSKILWLIFTLILGSISFALTERRSMRKKVREKLFEAFNKVYNPAFKIIYSLPEQKDMAVSDIEQVACDIDSLFMTFMQYIPEAQCAVLRCLIGHILLYEDGGKDNNSRAKNQEQIIKKDFRRLRRYIVNYYFYLRKEMHYPSRGVYQDYLSIFYSPRISFVLTVLVLILVGVPYLKALLFYDVTSIYLCFIYLAIILLIKLVLKVVRAYEKRKIRI